MQFGEFKRIVTCFADRIDDVDTSHGELLVQVREETITAKLHQRADGLLVEENGDLMPAVAWIVRRLARVPLLANRIASYVTPPAHFVAPAGRLLKQPDEEPSGSDAERPNAAEALAETLGLRPAGMTSVLYLTSDAGEGKTSLINEVAVRQAEAYKAKRTDWLLVPVPLGGRTFLRFDDVVVSALVNRLRFQLLYYDAFIELVRLGVLVPAFDGFEEMIVESSSGEALSALGGLVGKLRSAGTLLVAARKAYFDYPNFGSQARLFDTIGSDGDVAFGRLSLTRWDRRTFTRYASERCVASPEELFKAVSARLGQDHPILTRAVLVRRLIDVATEENDLAALLERIGEDERNYFHDFVESIVEREAQYKWTDTSGGSSGALLTTDEHHELLAMLAQEMWLGSTDELGTDVLALVVEMFCEVRRKSPAVARQMQERIKQHSLLQVSRLGRTTLAFDHEHFRIFYLGQALGRALLSEEDGSVRGIMDRASLPASAIAEAAGYLRREETDTRTTVALLQSTADSVLTASFVKENCGLLTLALLDGGEGPHEIRNMSFPAGALRERRLKGLRVVESYFHATSLADTALSGCRFVGCQFERFELDGTEQILRSGLEEDCEIGSVVQIGGEDGDQISWFDPGRIRQCLIGAGFEVGSDAELSGGGRPEPETSEDLVLTQRFLRAFLRSTAVNEATLRRRLGVRANYFFKELLPKLERVGVVRDVPYQGKGSQRRLRLMSRMTQIEEAMSGAEGRFDRFVEGMPRGQV